MPCGCDRAVATPLLAPSTSVLKNTQDLVTFEKIVIMCSEFATVHSTVRYIL